MEIIAGNVYFVRDSFFQKVEDPYLKINYDTTKRPHYFAFQDAETSLYWLVPCSSRIEKFERILEQKKERHKPTEPTGKTPNKQAGISEKDIASPCLPLTLCDKKL